MHSCFTRRPTRIHESVYFSHTAHSSQPSSRTWAGVFRTHTSSSLPIPPQFSILRIRAPCLHTCFWIPIHITGYVSWCVCVCIYIRVVLSFVLRLGTGITGQKRRVRRRKKGKGERVEGRKGHGEEEEDRLVARIRFRTVSNDTGQDTTMFSKILIPRHLFLHSFLLLFLSSFSPFFFLFFSFFFLFATCSEP